MKKPDKEIKAAQRAYDLMSEIERDKYSNPLTLEGVIRSIILKNPNMIQYRDDALNIMYCVLGSGIGWDNGRLGDRTPNNYMNMPPQVGGQGCWSREFGMAESLKQMECSKELEKQLRQRHEKEMIEAIDTIYDIDKRCQQYQSKKSSWYRISWYNCNLCVPKNAQKDFFEGAIEAATLIIDAKPQLGTKEWIVHQRTKKYAGEILEVLMNKKEHK